jgi:flavin reductase (DIM6/NTAB) family NADH-FMN oxidoreductase RutF
MSSRVEEGEGTTLVRPDLPTALDPAALRRAFGAFPSGVVAVAAEVEGVPVGMVASSFTSLSLEPALVSFSIANTSSTWPLLRRSARVGLSVLADHHDEVCRRLAGPAGERFDGLSLLCSDDGAVLLEDAVATFDCSIFREVVAGDHTIVLLQLHEVQDTAAGSPLVFHRSCFGRIAG